METWEVAPVVALLVAFGVAGCGPSQSNDDDLDGETVSESVGAAGGTVEHPNGAALHVPAGALAEDVELSILPIAAPSAEKLGAKPLGAALKLGPDGTRFLVPVEVVVPFDRTKLPEGTAPTSLRVMIAPDDSDEFAQLETAVDLESGVLVAKTLHFSTVVPALPEDSVTITRPESSLSAVQGDAFSQTFVASGGTSPYSWSLASGTLPAGLDLSAAGVLAGTVRESGDFAFSVRATDASTPAISTEKAYAMTVTATVGPTPAPTVTSITPNSVPEGTTEQILVVTGENFTAETVVVFSGLRQEFEPATTFIDASSLSASVPSELLAVPGSYRVWVETPEPGGGTSNTVFFEVVSSVPRLDSITPAGLIFGTSSTVSFSGARFVDGSVVVVGEAGTEMETEFVDGNTLKVEVDTSEIGAGFHDVWVKNPDDAISEKRMLIVTYPVPEVTAVSPAEVAAGSGDTLVEVTGANFVPGATGLRFAGEDLEATVKSSTLLEVLLPAHLLVSGAGAYVQVFTAGPGGGVSANGVDFNITGASVWSTVTALEPSTVVAGSATSTHLLTGSDFTDVSRVFVGMHSMQITNRISDTGLEFLVPAELKAEPGEHQVVVRNGITGGLGSMDLIVTAAP